MLFTIATLVICLAEVAATVGGGDCGRKLKHLQNLHKLSTIFSVLQSASATGKAKKS